MGYEVLQKDSMQVIGIKLNTSFKKSKKDIPKHWDKFLQENILEKIPNKKSDTVIAVYSDYAGDYLQPYSLTIGAEVSSIEEVPENMTSVVVPASKFVHFQAKGEMPQSIVDTWQKIWDTPMNRKYVVDFEVYKKDCVDIFISIQD